MKKLAERVVVSDDHIDIQDSGKACAYFNDRACNDDCAAFNKHSDGGVMDTSEPEFEFFVSCGRGNFRIKTINLKKALEKLS